LDFRIRQLQCFLTLSEVLNYGRASRALYLSQPTLTFQIKSLEEAFGVRLFHRSRNSVCLTEAGQAFRDYARTILKTVEEAKLRLKGVESRLHLRVCCGPVGQHVVLPGIIRSLARDYPGFELEILELTTEQQIAALPSGEVDALLMVGALPIPGMRFDPISKETLVAIVPRDSSLANKRAISVYDLREKGIIASSLKDCRFHQPFLHTLLAPFGITPRIIVAPYSCSVQFAYVAAGEGIAIGTESMMACTFPNVVALPFKEELPMLQLGLVAMESNNTEAMQIFRQIVLDNELSFLHSELMGQLHPATDRLGIAKARYEAV